MSISKKLVALTIVSIALLSGCGQTRQTSQTATETPSAVPVVPSSEPTATGTPAWIAELQREETALGQMVEQGRLGEVHGQAEKLQALLIRIEKPATDLTPAQQQQLDEHIRASGALVNEIHNAGDAGDLTKVKAKHQEFQTHLRAIEGVFGVATP